MAYRSPDRLLSRNRRNLVCGGRHLGGFEIGRANDFEIFHVRRVIKQVVHYDCFGDAQIPIMKESRRPPDSNSASPSPKCKNFMTVAGTFMLLLRLAKTRRESHFGDAPEARHAKFGPMSRTCWPFSFCKDPKVDSGSCTAPYLVADGWAKEVAASPAPTAWPQHWVTAARSGMAALTLRGGYGPLSVSSAWRTTSSAPRPRTWLPSLPSLRGRHNKPEWDCCGTQRTRCTDASGRLRRPTMLSEEIGERFVSERLEALRCACRAWPILLRDNFETLSDR
jgi:hypothetical protein